MGDQGKVRSVTKYVGETQKEKNPWGTVHADCSGADHALAADRVQLLSGS